MKKTPDRKAAAPWRIGVCLAALISCSGLFAQSPVTNAPGSRAGVVEAPNSLPPDRVEIPNTQALGLHSSIVGQEYQLSVNLPSGYQGGDQRYPVLYVLDGQWDFVLASAIYGEQYYDGFIPGIITVGISWGGSKDPDFDKLRARDFTPSSPDGSQQWGNAAKFMAFIKRELIPWVDSRYRTEKNERTLMGSSLGGLFTLYALFTETQLFNRYVLTSPAFQWDNGVLDSFEKEYAQDGSKIPVHLFMGVGALEPNAPAFQQYADHLKQAKYPGLTLETRVLENTGHSGTKAEGYSRGLQSVFARPTIKLDPATLAKYAGVYRDGNDSLQIVREKDHLVFAGGNGPGLLLNAESENDLYVKGMYLVLHVKKNDSGEVQGLRLELYGRQREFTKTK